MFQDNISVILCLLDGCIIILQDGNTFSIIIGCRAFCRTCLRKAFCQVKAEAIHFIFLQQELQIALHEFTHQRAFVVEIVEYTIRMGSLNIEVRIIFRSLVTIPIQLGKRIVPGGVIIDHIENDSHTRFMASVNKLLIHGFCTISLVHRKEEARIIPPTVVSIKLLHRHQFDGIDSHSLQIRELTHRTIDVAGSGEVT